jgi:hypothetical protein
VSDLGTPISELPAATLTGAEIVPLVQGAGNFNTTLDDILALADTTIGLPEGYSVVPFTQSVLTDQTATLTAAMAELDADTGGVVLIPAGTFYSRIAISGRSNLTFRGVSASATTIVAPSASIMTEVSGLPRGNFTFEDMTFDLASAIGVMVIYPDDYTVTFRRCRFINITNYAIGMSGAVGTTIEDCEFDDGGQAVGMVASITNATHGLRWIRSKARFMSSGLIFDVSPHDQIDIDGGLFDGGWPYLRVRPGGYTNSGGTVTYSGLVLTDSAASFGTIPTPYLVNIRALPVLESGSTGTTYFANYLSDATATFETALVKPGHIVRTATKWGVVATVFSETKLYVEDWFDTSTYRPTEPPATSTAYTVHRVLMAVPASNTATTITVHRWFDYIDGATVTPANGTLYEVLINHGQYSGIHASATDSRATGAIKNIRIHGGCHITRCWNDQLSIYGSDARLVVDSTVLIDHGQDFGITSHGDRCRIFGTVVHHGATNIACDGVDCRIDAFVSGAPYNNVVDGYLADMVLSGTRTRLSGSIAVASGAFARYGFSVLGLTGFDPPDAIDLTGTTASGYSVGEYRFYGDAVGIITDTVLRDVDGVISEGGTGGAATGTVDWRSTSEVQTTVGAAGGASAVPASPTKYIKVTVDGTDYVIPGFAVS